MTDKIDDGGLYHPLPDTNGYHSQLGITRRDWLAGLAMQGIMSSGDPWVPKRTSGGPAGVAVIQELAYEVADAMIAEGRKERDDDKQAP